MSTFALVRQVAIPPNMLTRECLTFHHKKQEITH